MAQHQPRRDQHTEPIKYGDVFPVSGRLSGEPITPQDAAAMQSAENQVLGMTPKGGPAAVMQSAATWNVQAGAVDADDASDVVAKEGVWVRTAEVDGTRVVTEGVGREVIGQYMEEEVLSICEQENVRLLSPEVALGEAAVTIGEALESAGLSAGDKPVEQSDAAAIQAAETRAIGSNEAPAGGIGAEAQSAAMRNTRATREEDKVKLRDVLGDATGKLEDDKAATMRDAEEVISAEIRNNPKMAPALGGVGDSVADAARLNWRGMVNQEKYD